MLMIHVLPSPIKDCTHVHITGRRDFPGSGIVLHYRFGTTDGDGAFVPDPLLREVKRTLHVDRADRIRERAKGNGAPVTAGVQEYRIADALSLMDEEAWWLPD